MVSIVHWQKSIEPDREITAADAAAAAAAAKTYKMKSAFDDEEASELTWVQPVATRWCIGVPVAIRLRCYWCPTTVPVFRDLCRVRLEGCVCDVFSEAGQNSSTQDTTADTRHSTPFGNVHVHRHQVCLHWIGAERSRIQPCSRRLDAVLHHSITQPIK